MKDQKTLTFPQILDSAADHMEARGWNKGFREDDDKTVCALGALNLALGAHAGDMVVDRHPVLMALIRVMGLPVGISNAWVVADWSNASNQKTVVNGFRRTAKILRTEALA